MPKLLAFILFVSAIANLQTLASSANTESFAEKTFAMKSLSTEPEEISESLYKIMQNAYDQAEDIPSLEEVPFFGDTLSPRCIEIHKAKSNLVTYTVIGRFEKTLLPEGPLVPGRIITKVILDQSPSLFMFDEIENEMEEDHLMITHNRGDESWKKTYLKKSLSTEGKLLFNFKVKSKTYYYDEEDEERKSRTKTSYGYCYSTE